MNKYIVILAFLVDILSIFPKLEILKSDSTNIFYSCIRFGSSFSDDYFEIEIESLPNIEDKVIKISLISYSEITNPDFNIFSITSPVVITQCNKTSIVLTKEKILELIHDLELILSQYKSGDWSLNPKTILVSSHYHAFRFQLRQIELKRRKGKFNYLVSCAIYPLIYKDYTEESKVTVTYGDHLFEYGNIFEKNTNWVKPLEKLIIALKEV